MDENLYEGMFLVDSGKFAADPDKCTNTLLGILEKAGATVVAHRPWQDGRLEYPIEGHRRGLHYLLYFRMAGSGVPTIDRSCKLNDTVLRHLLVKHPQVLFDSMVQALNADESPPADEPKPKKKDDSTAESKTEGIAAAEATVKE